MIDKNKHPDPMVHIIQTLMQTRRLAKGKYELCFNPVPTGMRYYSPFAKFMPTEPANETFKVKLSPIT